MKCKSCGRNERLYKHYQSGIIMCLSCIPGWELEAGMWKAVKNEKH